MAVTPYLYRVTGRGLVPAGPDGKEIVREIDAVSVIKQFAEVGGFLGYALYYRVSNFGADPHEGAHTNYSQEWIRHYQLSRYHALDPCLNGAQALMAPLTWCDLRSLHPEAEAVFRDAEDYGMVDGICIPLHGPFNSWAVISLASKARISDQDLIYWGGRGMQLGATLFSRIIDIKTAGRARPKELSKRQREVMLLMAQGRSFEQMSVTLGVTEATLKETLAAAKAKLGVAHREQAIVAAIVHGQISPNTVVDTYSVEPEAGGNIQLTASRRASPLPLN